MNSQRPQQYSEKELSRVVHDSAIKFTEILDLDYWKRPIKSV